MANGVPMLGQKTKKCKVLKESPFIFRIVLIQGLNRQIRRMCEYFGYEVTRLERVRIMNVGLKGLPTGDWRDLDEQELSGLFKMIEHSSSEAPIKKQERKKQPHPNPESTPRSVLGAPARGGKSSPRSKRGKNSPPGKGETKRGSRF